MTKKLLLGITLAAVLAVTLISTPVADAITELFKTRLVIEDDDEYEKIVFKLASAVPLSGEFGGYAVFTDGHVIAVTSHAPFYDSEAQVAPTLPEVISFPGPAALCNAADPGCGPEWHTHLVHPIDALDDMGNPICAFKAVGALTFEEPSDEVKIRAMKIVLKEIEMEEDDFTDAVSGDEMNFTPLVFSK